jgi:hypothetical protein
MQPATIKQFAIESLALVNYIATIDELPDGSYSIRHTGSNPCPTGGDAFVIRQNQDKRDWFVFTVSPIGLESVGAAPNLVDAFRLVAFAVYGSVTSCVEVKLAEQESKTTPQVHENLAGIFQPVEATEPPI